MDPRKPLADSLLAVLRGNRGRVRGHRGVRRAAPRLIATALAACAAAANGLGAQETEPFLGERGPIECGAAEAAVRGTVADARTGDPLPTARVSLRATPDEPADSLHRTETDRYGSFDLCIPAPANAVLAVEFQGRAVYEGTLRLEAGQTHRLELAADPGHPGGIEGRVLEGTGREPVPRALVTLEPLGAQALTDSTGAFEFSAVPPGRYAIAVHHPAGVRIDSLEVRPRSRVGFETRLVAREVVLDSVRVDPALREPPRRGEEAEGAGGEARRGGVLQRVAGGVASALLDRRTLRAWGANRLSQALTLVPGVELVRRCAGELRTACGFLPRLSPEDECGEATIYLDGQALPRDPEGGRLSDLPLESVDRVRVVPGGETLPEALGGGVTECGAVLAWSSGDGGD